MISVTEIILIAVGILAVILGYLIPAGSEKMNDADLSMNEQKVSEMVRRAIQNSQGQIDDMLDDCMEDAINKAERAMDRVTNEKMSAISEYSDTVMNDIHRNHDEVMFMYDMLNDKHKNLKNTVSEVDRAAKEVKQTAKEVVETVEQAESAAKELSARELSARSEVQAVYRPEREVVYTEPKKTYEPSYENTYEKTYEDTYEDPHKDGPAAEEFSSLTDILDRADAAAAAKTQNKVIGSVDDEDYLDDETQEEIPVEASELDDEDGFDGFKEENRIAREEEENAANEVADLSEDIEEESVSAKVVSIEEASRKKAPRREEAVPEKTETNGNDPITRNQRILDMHKAGKSAVVIARELRLGIGEVKLVIDLAGKHNKKNRSSII
ncbi:MAG: hypothetical protein K6G06_02155 [Butyrivibrio sp.]|nr:hypothetical protein [Butyrivibrio sp.]